MAPSLEYPPDHLSREFPHLEAWNPSFEGRTDPSEVEWDLEVSGTIVLCHWGCALYDLLVVTGPARGSVWNDRRAEDGGLHPYRSASGDYLSFLDWYEGWLDSAHAGQLEASSG